MPNTLAHLGLQPLLTRAVLPRADLKWMWAACVLPDLPWITQRLLRGLLPEMSLYDLRLYAIVQSSLFVTLVLAAALALLSRRTGPTLVILAIGIVLHLLLDATQIKWANGVVLFAPFSWQITSFGFYWPENLPSYALGLLGAVYAAVAFWRERPRGPRWSRPVPARLVAAAVLVSAYVALPLLFVPAAADRDPHFVETLRNISDRTGKRIEIDRNPLRIEDTGRAVLSAWTGEEITLTGDIPPDAELISLRGRFSRPDTIAVEEVHVHPAMFRSTLTLAGLSIVIAWWILSLAQILPGRSAARGRS